MFTMAECQAPKKQRKANFSTEENEVIVDEVEKNQGILFSKLTNSVTNSRKKKLWDSICAKVNALSKGVCRSTQDVKKRWQDMQSAAKKKEVKRKHEIKKTGGGINESEEINSIDDRILGVLGPVAVDGIPGGIDSDKPVPNQNEILEETSATQEHQSMDVSVNESDPRNVSCDDVDLDESSESLIDNRTHVTSSIVPKDPHNFNPVPSTFRIQKCQTKAKRTSILRQYQGDEPNKNMPKDIIYIEKERLKIEKRRLEIEEERLKMQQEKHAMWKDNIPKQSQFDTDFQPHAMYQTDEDNILQRL